MKLKYFIRGLGAGIVFTALILGIISKAPEKEHLTDTEIKIKATELGMVYPTDIKEPEPQDTVEPEAPEPESQVEAKPEAPEPETIDKAEPDTPKPETIDKAEPDVPEIKDEAEPDTPQPKKPEDKKEKPKMISFSIAKGMYSSRVAKEIQKAGLVKDSKDFEDYLVENNYQSRIMVGDYEINSGATYKQIAEIITK